MSLLRDIQNATTDPGIDIATLLRKCKVLAVRLDNNELKEWVNNELNGYPNKDTLPKYRIVDTASFGDFHDTYGRGVKNAPIPPLSLPEDFRDFAITIYLTDPISKYASMLADTTRTSFSVVWPADLIAVFGLKIYQRMSCLSAWKILDDATLAGLIDTIKTRILNFALEIECEAPDAGEAPSNEPALAQDKVVQVFNTHISGNVQNVAAGSSNFTQKSSTVLFQAGDMHALKGHLRSKGISEPDLNDLEEALRIDSRNDKEIKLGSRAQIWIGKMVGKAASGAWGIGVSAAGGILGKALAGYLGLP